jgi:transposase-like protein
MNLFERAYKELKRRSPVATLFANKASLPRLVSVVLAKWSEEWEYGKIYLRILEQNAPLLQPLNLQNQSCFIIN